MFWKLRMKQELKRKCTNKVLKMYIKCDYWQIFDNKVPLILVISFGVNGGTVE